MNENGWGAGPAVRFRNLFNQWEHAGGLPAGVDVDFSKRSDNQVHIEQIYVPHELRGTGVGNIALEKLKSLADTTHILITLNPAWTDEEIAPTIDLFRWYERHGFHDGYDEEIPDLEEGELGYDARTQKT